jgi:RNA polymerase sigma factor (sigma-70 family)
MDNILCELTKKSQTGCQESMLAIIVKFTPLINKYCRKLNYDGAETDLIITLIETIKYIQKNDIISSEKQIVGYIATSIKNKYIQLSKKHGNIIKTELPLDFDKNHTLHVDIYDNILIYELLDNLTVLQREVITKKFIKDMSDVEIAKSLNISRQAVNKIKCRALKKLKDWEYK